MSNFLQNYIGAGERGQQFRAEEAKQNALKMYAPKALAGDRSAVQGLAQAGLVNEAQQFQSGFKAEDAARAQKEIADAEQRARPYLSVTTPEQLAEVNAMWAQQGVDPATLPKSVGEARFLTQKVMSIKDQLEQAFKQREFGLKEREFASKERLDRSGEAENYAQATAARAKAQGINSGKFAIMPDGSMVPTMKLTEAQSKDLGFHDRMAAAQELLNSNPAYTRGMQDLGSAIGRNVPFVGNYLQKNTSRQGMQVGNEFMTALLRKDTGAAVTDQEFALYGPLYLPQPGDDAATLALKSEARQRAIDGVRKGLGPAQILALEQRSAPPRSGGDGAAVPPPRQPAPPPNVIRYDAQGNPIQ